MSKYPFGRMAVGDVVTIPATGSKAALQVAASKIRDAARRDLGLEHHELPVFRIEEDLAGRTFTIERLPDGSPMPRGPRPRAEAPMRFETEWVADPPAREIDYSKRDEDDDYE